MTNKILLEKFVTSPFLGCKKETNMKTIANDMESLISKAYEFCKKEEIKTLSPPIARYFKWDTKEKKGELECGFLIDEKTITSKKLQKNKDLKQSELSGGKYLKSVHTGPYETLSKGWDEIMEFSKKKNLSLDESEGNCFEKYITSPKEEKDSNKLISELWWKLSKKHEREDLNIFEKVDEKKEEQQQPEQKKFKTDYSKGNPISHIDFQFINKEKVKKFYSNVFGWTFHESNYPSYFLFQSTENQGFLSKGGFYKRKNEEINKKIGIVPYIDVKDIDEAMKKFKENGGTVEEKVEIPGIGFSCRVTDTEGNYYSLYQQKK